jgi:carboxypeptidase C (cathepsin A)
VKTYGIQVFSQSLYEELMHNWTRPDGCKAKVTACQDSMKDREALSPGLSVKRNKNATLPCDDAAADCAMDAWAHYLSLDHGWYDIAHPKQDPFPAPHMYGYLREESVLAALGVPVNYSEISMVTAEGFIQMFDHIHGGYLNAIADLLDRGGVKVHLVYGDRDYACNWVGGEAASLAVPWSRAAEFAGAGYAPLLAPKELGGPGYEFGGMTRQLGNFSFTRVFQAGHEVPSYAPAAANAIFTRATFNRDIATGLLPSTNELFTEGPGDTWNVQHAPPEMPQPKCYILKPVTCLPEVWEKVKEGTAVVRDWFVVDDETEEEPFGEL